ncbi:hypothetical protein RhiirA4_34573 [Rhizophagus irregularis]|uniref:Uncharacterized protein n=1 Tax=Rhizophagus irregularis TaxID=588596 RepID=A0A2I1H2E7_9GLOM|nr:hypothetical protein RhiirA4_34573 [Rhizophagus irregularis]
MTLDYLLYTIIFLNDNMIFIYSSFFSKVCQYMLCHMIIVKTLFNDVLLRKTYTAVK